MAKAKAKKVPKAKKAAEAAPSSKRSLASNRRRRKARSNPARSSASANPPVLSDLTHVILPGFAAYAATRVLSRIVYSIVQKRWPKLGKHAAAAAGAAGFAGAWFLAHRVQKIAPYHDGILMGSGVAAAHGIAQCYMPKKYSWLLADCQPSDVLPAASNGAALPAQTSAATAGGDEYSYLEAQLDAMEGQGDRRTRIARPPKAQRTPVADAMGMAGGGGDADPDLTSELDPGEDVDDLYSGAFAPNN